MGDKWQLFRKLFGNKGTAPKKGPANGRAHSSHQAAKPYRKDYLVKKQENSSLLYSFSNVSGHTLQPRTPAVPAFHFGEAAVDAFGLGAGGGAGVGFSILVVCDATACH